ncbi:MAG: DNA sulfur modification protein DndD [Archangium sp.]|nr:DNA sulfur modification protein DndD [Archangium sp.]MDP3576299.1 DNA sulfur modification protein DndD [Archangium sp.]
MYIRSIKLRDWKAYVQAEFVFPPPTKKKNVVLIGAKNGFGKTSLLEGIVMGLFGRDGLAMVARAVMTDGEDERLAQSYDEFLQRALHAHALDQGRSSASVTVELEDDDEAITVQRTWHFSGNGKHRRDEEEVRIWHGPEQDPVRVPRFEDQDDFVRNFIAQKFLPVHLAQFFLFDGEQVQRLARRDMSAQVQMGIESILGVRVVRALQSDLRTFAQQRRNSVPKVGDETLERLRAEVRELEGKLEKAEGELGEIEPKLEPLKNQRDRLVKEFSSIHGGNSANLKELYENKGKFEREKDRIKERLAALVRTDLAIAIAGSELRQQLMRRLSGEAARSRWESGKEQGAEKLTKLLTALDGPEPRVEPPLTMEQEKAVRQKVRLGWESLWYPPPADCADSYRHRYLGIAERAVLEARLKDVDELALGELEDLLANLATAERDIKKQISRIAQLSGVEDRARKLTDELERVSTEHNELDGRVKDLKRHVEGDQGQLAPKRRELARLADGHQKAQPQLARAAMADRTADMLDGVIQESYPQHIERVGKQMTEAYQALAHKKLVKQIAIDASCNVQLLGDEGRDLRTMDASAGEDQIFALSLIAAIARVSARSVPVVMDTPLARLDPDHRKNVLRYFTERPGEQVILLSQPDEVSGRYLEAVKDRVCESYVIDHEEIANGVGINKVRKGYFEEF